MASTRKSHHVLIPGEDGSVITHSMKEWLRQHPEYVIDGLDATASTSQQLRGCLKKQGWSMQETDTEFKLIPPGLWAESSPLLQEMLEEPEHNLDEVPTTEEASFGLEHQLRDFLAQNLGSVAINGKRLKLYVDSTGRDGVEYPTALGRIDLLAQSDAGDFYVFELKRGRTPDYTMGQLIRYMGWVSQNIGKGTSVHGVIVAKVISDSLGVSLCIVPNVSLFEYEVSFSLRAVPGIAVT